MADRRPPPTPVSIVYLHARGMTPRLRALIDVRSATRADPPKRGTPRAKQ